MRWPGALSLHALAQGFVHTSMIAEDWQETECGEPRLVSRRLQSVVAFTVLTTTVLRTA